MVVLEVTLAGGQQALLGITCNEPWIVDYGYAENAATKNQPGRSAEGPMHPGYSRPPPQ
jgi:hypothetical protein